MLKIIETKFISWYYNNLLAGYLGTNNAKKLIGQKSYWSNFYKNTEAYIKECDICWTAKPVIYQLLGNLQASLVLTQR